MSGSSMPASCTLVPVSLGPTAPSLGRSAARTAPSPPPAAPERHVRLRRVRIRVVRPAVVARVLEELVAGGEGLQRRRPPRPGRPNRRRRRRRRSRARRRRFPRRRGWTGRALDLVSMPGLRPSARIITPVRHTQRTVIESLVEQIEGRFAELERQMSDPAVIADQARYAEVGREYRRLGAPTSSPSSGGCSATTWKEPASSWPRTARTRSSAR